MKSEILKKMKWILIFSLLIPLGIAFAGPEWQARMRALGQSLNEILPLISDSQKTLSQAEQKNLKEKSKLLAQLTKDLDQSLMTHGQSAQLAKDPIIPFMMKSFSQDVTEASELLQKGSSKYAQSLLRGSLTYCTACHIRTEESSPLNLAVFGDTVEKLPLIDRMKVLAATRNFERSLQAFNQEVDKKTIQSLRPFDVERASRLALALAVRVNQDPRSALEEIQKIKKIPNNSPVFQKEVQNWEKEVRSWMKEKKVKLRNQTDRLKQARKLFEKAEKDKEYPADLSSYVYYLRATALLHQTLENAGAQDLPEIYYLLGRSYNVLQEIGLWSLHEVYFEACIHAAPKSAIAEKCYKEFEDSVRLGYTGSAGEQVPNEIQEKLKKVKEMATADKLEKSDKVDKVENK